jgi:hypothetical protein
MVGGGITDGDASRVRLRQLLHLRACGEADIQAQCKSGSGCEARNLRPPVVCVSILSHNG